MKGKIKTDFCVCYREESPYSLNKKTVRETILGKDYDFSITTAVCEACGNQMSTPGIFELNSKEIDKQSRRAESIVSKMISGDFSNSAAPMLQCFHALSDSERKPFPCISWYLPKRNQTTSG